MADKKIYNETELLEQLIKGDQAAFHAVFDHYRNKIFSIAYKLLKDEGLAEDAVQEVFTKLWLQKEKLHQVNNFNAYINTITRNYLFNQLKRMAYAERFLRLPENNIKIYDDSVVERVEFNELNSKLVKVVSKLPPQQKKVYQLGKEEGLRYEEIAQLLQISKETVKTHMAAALRSVKNYLLQQEQVISWIIFIIASVGFLFS